MTLATLRHHRWQFLATILLLALPFLAFGRALTLGYAPIDDAYLVAHNLATRGPTWHHLVQAFTTFDPELYIPLTLVSFQINYLISGLAPWSYHLVNILLHGCNALLIFLILKKLTGARRASLFAAALFAAHPLNAEAVVWITARKDLLSAFFALLALLTYMRRTRTGYGLALLFFLLGLLAKVSIAPLAAGLLIVDRQMDGRWTVRSLLRAIPFLVLAQIFIAIAFSGKGFIVKTSHPVETLLLIPRATLFLLGKFLYPTGLSPLYEVSDPITIKNPTIFLPILAFFASLAFLAYIASINPLRLRSGQAKSEFRSPILTLTLPLTLTFLLLAPSFLSFFKVGSVFLTSDRYAYLPLLGILMAIVFALRALHERFPSPKKMTAGGGALLIVALSLLSIKQTALWTSGETLFGHAVEVTPRSVAAHGALAQTLLDAERPEEAFAVLKRSLKNGDDIRLHLIAGNIYARVGQVEDALAQFHQALAMNPRSAEAAFSVGSVLEQTGRIEEALSRYRDAASFDPSDVPSLTGIGRILAAAGDLAGAEDAFRRALRWNPNAKEAHQGLAPILYKTGRADEAETHVKLANGLAERH